MLQQQFGEYQFIIVDNGLSKSFLNACRRVENIFLHRMKILKSSATNTYDLMNVGLSAARGKYVIFITERNMPLPNFLLTLYSAAEQTNADVVHMSNYGVPQGKTNPMSVAIKTDEIGWTDNSNAVIMISELQTRLIGFLNGAFAPAAYNKLIRREILTENNISFESSAQMPEWIFSFQCLFAAKNYVRIPHPLYIRLSDAITTPADSNINYRVAVGNKTLLEFMNGVNFFADDIDKQNSVLQAYLKHFNN